MTWNTEIAHPCENCRYFWLRYERYGGCQHAIPSCGYGREVLPVTNREKPCHHYEEVAE